MKLWEKYFLTAKNTKKCNSKFFYKLFNCIIDLI
jgi:hypothetical protein